MFYGIMTEEGHCVCEAESRLKDQKGLLRAELKEGLGEV
jgi:hypothetical protein